MNVLNVNSLERELQKFAVRAIHPQAQRWVMTVARNHFLKTVEVGYYVYKPPTKRVPFGMPMPDELPPWAITALREGITFHYFDPVQVRRRSPWQILEAVVEWFNTFPATDTRLNRLDRICWEEAANRAIQWAKDISQNLWSYVKDKPPVVREYEKGFKWVRLHTQLHFEREGKLMRHCVHNGGYYDGYRRGKSEYYSLRDKNNQPHVTMEVNVTKDSEGRYTSRAVTQCKGQCNQKPAATYQPYIRRFITDLAMVVQGDIGNIDK